MGKIITYTEEQVWCTSNHCIVATVYTWQGVYDCKMACHTGGGICRCFRVATLPCVLFRVVVWEFFIGLDYNLEADEKCDGDSILGV